MRTEFHGLLEDHPKGLRKPLYLQGQNGLAVELDGPALRIVQPARAMTFYPLARLACVLSKGGVHWSCEALLACAEARIPVVFLHGDGGVRAYLFGSALGEAALYQRLRELLRHTDGLRQYQEWRRRMMCHAQRALLEQLRQHRCGVELVLAGSDVVAGCRQPMIVVMPDKMPWRRLCGLLAGLSVQLLQEAGIDAGRLCHLERLPLVDDLAELLVWAVLGPILIAQCGAKSSLNLADERGLTALVEGQRDEVLRFGRLLLAQLRYCLEG